MRADTDPFCCSLALVRWLYDKPGLFLEGAREEPLVMEKQQPAKASLQFHCGEWKKKRITLRVEKLRRVWDGSCISGQKKKIYIYQDDGDVNRLLWFQPRQKKSAGFMPSCRFDAEWIKLVLMFPFVIICRGRCSLLSQHLSANLFGIVHTHARPDAYPVENRFTRQQWVSLSHRLAGHAQWEASLRMFWFFLEKILDMYVCFGWVGI